MSTAVAALPAPERPGWRRLVDWTLPKLAALALVLGCWWLLVRLQVKPTYILPPPGDVLATLRDEVSSGRAQEAIFNSLRRAAVGYAVSMVVGTLVGLLLARVAVVRVALGSAIASLQSLPSVAWAPVGLLWFGLTDWAIYFVVFMGAFPSIASGTASAVDQVAPLLVRAGRSMGATGVSLYRHVILPAAVPGYIAGLKQAWAFSWRSLMAAELIAVGPTLHIGLGQLLNSGHELLDMSLMLSTVFLILVIGLAVDALIFAPLTNSVQQRRGLSPEAQ